MKSVSVYIQAGGQSSRMGRDKALLPLGESTCIERVWAVAKQISTQVMVVTQNPKSYEFLNCPMIPDIYRGIGPLGGIHAALQHCPTDWALVLACDLPLMTAELLRYLMEHTEAHDAVVPKDAEERLQPLCALYARSCLPQVRHLITTGEAKPRALFSRVRTRIVEWSEISSQPGAELFFFDIDTPESYEHARSLFQYPRKPIG